MNKSLLKKAFVLGLLFILLLVPLGLIDGLVAERQSRGQEVIADIERSTFAAQTVTGPLLLLPYRRTLRWEVTVGEGDETRSEWRSRVEEDHLLLAPDTLDAGGNFAVETRARQLYEARLLHGDLTMTGRFTLPSRQALERPGNAGETVSYEWQPAVLVIGIADSRGIRAVNATAAGETLAFLPGTGARSVPGGVMAALALRPAADVQPFDFRVNLDVSSMESLALVPVGGRTVVELAGRWPHPSYFGRQLPVAHTASEEGFKARWETTYFASGITAARLAECEASAKCRLDSESAFGVRVVKPVDRYLMTDRTLKYASLFLLLTFVTCFLVEVMKQVRVHPVQYLLVGAAQAMFFLLVLALSEHIAFALAYIAASAAIVMLLGYYAAAILGGAGRGAGFAAVTAALYAMLFGILQSEDNALLLGALGLLLALSVVMAVTRRVDWYRFGETAAPEAG